MAKYYSLADAARELGCHRATTKRHADALGLGEQLVGGVRVLTAADLRKLRKSIASARPGNPGERGENGRFKKS